MSSSSVFRNTGLGYGQIGSEPCGGFCNGTAPAQAVGLVPLSATQKVQWVQARQAQLSQMRVQSVMAAAPRREPKLPDAAIGVL